VAYPFDSLVYPTKTFAFTPFYTEEFATWIIAQFDWWDDSGNTVTVRVPARYDIDVQDRTIDASVSNTGVFLAEIAERQHEVQHRRWYQLSKGDAVQAVGSGNGEVSLGAGRWATRALLTLEESTYPSQQGANPPKLGGIGFVTFSDPNKGCEVLQPIETDPQVFYPQGYGNDTFKIFVPDSVSWQVEVHGVPLPVLKAGTDLSGGADWDFPPYEYP